MSKSEGPGSAESNSYNDRPITVPEGDRYGIDPFARALARAIRKLDAPNGSVVALNGPWGSGKSSAANLVRYHLLEAIKSGELAIIDFACWWFRGEEALALAFFRELYVGISPSLEERARRVLPMLGARLLKAGSAVGAALDWAGASGAGATAGGVMGWLAEFIKDDETVEKLHSDLSRALSTQSKRFLVVIDDIDRLSPDEALLIFRLVKSVGRLPNVMYLLVYDRQLAEKIVADRFPSEGPHYLEKIVQAAFELPEPTQTDLWSQALGLIERICGRPAEDRMRDLMNHFYETIAPALRTPRDVMRLANTISVTWPAVAGEVDVGDFLAIETLRLRYPQIYRAIRQNKGKLCKRQDGNSNQAAISAEYDELLLGSIEEKDREPLRRSLIRLFPALSGVWKNYHYGYSDSWGMQRRVCSEPHFEAYFRFALGAETVSLREIDELVSRAGDGEYVKSRLRGALGVKRQNGGTLAAAVLDEMILHAGRVEPQCVEPLLSALFEVADELDIDADQERGFGSFANNGLRLHWLLRRLTFERYSLPDRSAIFMEACKTAAVGWLVDFANSAHNDYHPGKGKQPEREERCLTTLEDASLLGQQALDAIRRAATDETLAAHRHLPYLLHRWVEFADDEGAEVRAWTSAQLDSDAMVACFAGMCTSVSWSFGLGGFGDLGDRVSISSVRASVGGLDQIMDVDKFRQRLTEVQAHGSPQQQQTITTFLNAWERKDRDPDD